MTPEAIEQYLNSEIIDHIAKLARHNNHREPEKCSAILGDLEKYVRKKVMHLRNMLEKQSL